MSFISKLLSRYKILFDSFQFHNLELCYSSNYLLFKMFDFIQYSMNYEKISSKHEDLKHSAGVQNILFEEIVDIYSLNKMHGDFEMVVW
jgi:hypothetical protein